MTSKEDGDPGSVLATRRMMVITTQPLPPTETPSQLMAIVMSPAAAPDTLEPSAEDTAELAEVMDTPQATRSLEDHLTMLTASTETPAKDMASPLAIAMSTTSRRLALMAEIATTRGLRDVPPLPAVATDSAENVIIPAADTLVETSRTLADTRPPEIIPLAGISPTTTKPAVTRLAEITLLAVTRAAETTLPAVAMDSAENAIIPALAVAMDIAENVTLIALTAVLMVEIASTLVARTNHRRTVIECSR